jgi:hypothetical protein
LRLSFWNRDAGGTPRDSCILKANDRASFDFQVAPTAIIISGLGRDRSH